MICMPIQRTWLWASVQGGNWTSNQISAISVILITVPFLWSFSVRPLSSDYVFYLHTVIHTIYVKVMLHSTMTLRKILTHSGWNCVLLLAIVWVKPNQLYDLWPYVIWGCFITHTHIGCVSSHVTVMSSPFVGRQPSKIRYILKICPWMDNWI